MPAKERCLPRAKASSAMEKVNSLNGDQHAMIIGNQAVAHKVTIVPSIIQDDNQVDVQYAVLPDMTLPDVLVQSNPEPRMQSGMSRWAVGKKPDQWETEEYEASKGKKGKGKGTKSKGKSKAKAAPRSITPRPKQSSPTKNDRSQPKAKAEARSCMTNDFLFAMMNNKSKPTWRHSTWKDIDYMICTVAEPQKEATSLQARQMVSVGDA